MTLVFKAQQPNQVLKREISRGAFEFKPEVIEFCPNIENFLLNQGFNRQFCGYLSKSLSTQDLGLFSLRFNK